MANAEMAESGVPRDDEVALQVLDVGRRRLLLVLITIPSLAAEWQERLTELPEMSQFLVGCCYERCFGAFVLVIGWFRGVKKAESGVHGPIYIHCDLLEYHRGSLVSGPTQKRASWSGMATLPATFSMSWA